MEYKEADCYGLQTIIERKETDNFKPFSLKNIPFSTYFKNARRQGSQLCI
jgi:hypothetical protein